MVNDRKKNQDESENSNPKKPAGGENRPGQARQTQGGASRGKQFEGGRESSGSSSEGGSQPKTSRPGGKSKTETANDDRE